MNKGTVKFFNADKGWGFIKDENGTEYFAHHSHINMDGFRFLEEGESVAFDVGSSERGPMATNISVVYEG